MTVDDLGIPVVGKCTWEVVEAGEVFEEWGVSACSWDLVRVLEVMAALLDDVDVVGWVRCVDLVPVLDE